jgi:hypothetical protein
MADLEFDPHARDEMARDVMSEDEVYHVVGDADEIIERHDGRSEYARMMEDGRWIVVIVDQAYRTVETVWWDTRRSRRRDRRRR